MPLKKEAGGGPRELDFPPFILALPLCPRDASFELLLLPLNLLSNPSTNPGLRGEGFVPCLKGAPPLPSAPRKSCFFSLRGLVFGGGGACLPSMKSSS